MNSKNFDVSKFNVIEDEENYYFFRAITDTDLEDLTNPRIKGLRTNRERWEENSNKGAPKYTATDKMSIEQVYDQIKTRHRWDTNCISLSSNANVTLVYGRSYNFEQYAMITVPKKEMGQKVVNAGQYMLQEIEKRISSAIDNLDVNTDKEILESMEKIDNAKTIQELNDIFLELYSKIREPETKKYRGKKVDFSTKTGAQNRLSSYQALSEEQTLDKNKIVTKLTILERSKKMKMLIPYTITNSKIIETVGMAFSSSEQVYYGRIPGEIITQVPKELMDIFALLQQQDKNNVHVSNLKKEIIKYVNEGYRIEKQNGKIVFTNGTEIIELKNIEDSFIVREDEKVQQTSIEEMYGLTKGKVSYNQAIRLVNKLFYLSKSRGMAREFAQILNIITKNNPEYQEVIKEIQDNGFEIEPEIITRRSEKGYKLSEAVNLDMQKNELEIVEYIKSLTQEELEEITKKGGMTDINDIISKFFNNTENKEPVDKNMYYANAILESYNWRKVGIEFTEEEKQEVLKKFQKQDCVALYNKLKEIGIEEKNIPISIINIITREKFANIIEKDSLNDYLKELQRDTSIEQIEKFLGYYNVPATGIVLKDYQQRAVDKIDEAYEEKRFTSVILPTGAGKSYVALAELMKHKDEPMVYYAPSNEILSQIKDKIIKYIHGREGTLGKTTDEIVKEVFPNLKFETYSSLLYKAKENLQESKYKFIILDELHRTGAEKWGQKLDWLLEAQEDGTRILGMTATPQRDRDGKDMAYETALKLGYTEEEVKQDQHTAMKMDLIDAIRAGIVVNPRLVSCEYNVQENGIIEKLNERIRNINNEEKRKELETKLEKLRRNLGKTKKIPELFEENITKKDGKYILFIPVRYNGQEFEDEEGNKIGQKTAKQKIENAQKQIKEWLKNIDAEPEFYSMLAEYGDKKNALELHNFENSDSDHIKIMTVMNKLNEGIHVEGIDGIIWQRALDEDSKILLLQQLGRCIYSIDENSAEERPVIIDLPNNMLKVNLNKVINTYTPKDDLTLLEEAVDWVQMHNERIPDINSTSREEAIKASTLKRIQAKYSQYLEELGENLEQDKIEQIRRILELGAEIDLWNEVFPEKTINTEDINLELCETFFELTGVLKDLYEIENEVKKEDKPTFEQLIEWVEEHDGRFPRSNIKGKNRVELMTEEENDEINLYARWRHSDEYKVLKKYAGQPLESIPEEYRKKIQILRELGLNPKPIAKLGLVAQTIEVLEILKQNGVQVSEINASKKVEGKNVRTLLKDVKQEGIDIEKIIDDYGLDENFKIGNNITHLRQAYKGTGKYEITEDEKRKVEEFGIIIKGIAEQMIEVAQILHKNGVDLKTIKENKEKKHILLKEINQEGIDISKIIEENGLDENFQYGQIFYTLKRAYRGTKTDIVLEEGQIEQLEKIGVLNPEMKEGKEEKENKKREAEAQKKKIEAQKKETKKKENTIKRSESDLSRIETILDWCIDKYKDKKIYERELPNQRSTNEVERKMFKDLYIIREKMEKYTGIRLEEIKDEVHRNIVETLRRLESEYNLGDYLKNALKIQEWCEETFRDKKIYERRLPRRTKEDEYENKLGRDLSNIEQNIIRKYNGKELEQIEDDEDRRIVEIIKKLKQEYGMDEKLKNLYEIQEWCEENNRNKPKCNRKLPSSNKKNTYEGKLGRALINAKQYFKYKYGIKNINEKIVAELPEEDRQILKKIRYLEKEYNGKLTAQQIGQATFDAPIQDCDNAQKTLEQAIEAIRGKKIGEL